MYGLISSIVLTQFILKKQADQVIGTHELQIQQRNPEFLLVVQWIFHYSNEHNETHLALELHLERQQEKHLRNPNQLSC